MAILATELRIGNIIQLKDDWYKKNPELFNTEKIVTVYDLYRDSLFDDYLTVSGYDINDLEPIFLTEEWFLKFGFGKKENDAWFRKKLPKTYLSPDESVISYNNGTMVWRQFSEQGMSIKSAAEIITKMNGKHEVKDASFNLKYNTAVIECKIEYVHQLQNLYFALTGEELT